MTATVTRAQLQLRWNMSAAFERYIGIDYSGAETCESSLKGLRVYMADRATEPREVPRSSSTVMRCTIKSCSV